MTGSRHIHRYSSLWYDLYLSSDPMYRTDIFRQRFPIQRTLFLKIKSYLVSFDAKNWSTRIDGLERPGILLDVKILACLSLYCTGRSLYDLENSRKMGKETLQRNFRRFWTDIVKVYGEVYLN